MGETILEMQHIAKAFSGVSALKDAQLTLRKGSVMAAGGRERGRKIHFNAHSHRHIQPRRR